MSGMARALNKISGSLVSALYPIKGVLKNLVIGMIED